MATTQTDDLLQQMVLKAEAACSGVGVTVVHAWLSDQSYLPELTMQEVSTGGIDAFLSVVKQLGIKLVAIDTELLTDDDIESRLAELRETDEGDEEVERDVERCRSFVGHIAILRLAALLAEPPAVIRCSLWPAWHDTIFPDSDGEDSGGDDEEEDRKARELRYEDFARRVADDPRMVEATNQATRERIVRQVLGAEASEWNVSRIAREADADFHLRVLPTVERQMRERHGKGATLDQIAAELGVSVKRVRALLR